MPKTLLAAALAVLTLTTSALAAPDTLTECRKLMDRGMNWTAVEKLAALTAEDGENAAAWALLAECRLLVGDPENAEKAAYCAVDLKEDVAAYWKLWGRTFFEKGVAAAAAKFAGNTIKSMFADAEMKFRKALELDPGDPELRWWLGWTNEWMEYPDKARAEYEEQIGKFPKEIGGYRRLGQMLASQAIQLGNGIESDKARAEAIETFEKGLAKAGDDAETLYYLGIALEWAARKSDAKAAYLRAIKADPGYDNAWQRAFKIGVGADVLQPLAAELLRKDRAAAVPAMWLGYFHINRDPKEGEPREKRYQDALAVLLPALKEHGEHGGIYGQAFAAANSLLGLRKTAEAVEAFEKIHECYPWSGDAANNLGLFYRDTGNYKESLKWYLAAAERAPQSQDILNDTGLIYLFHGSGDERKKCLPYFEKVVSIVKDEELAPERGYWDALENLCKYYWEVDRQPEKVVEYADMRYEVTNGVEPYNMSPQAQHYKKLAEKELSK